MVYDKVVEIIADSLDVNASAITADSVITEDLGADSLDVVDICMAFEDEFGIKIPDEAIENIRTVGDIVNYIEDNQ